jgi:hypothetical protein
MRLLLVACLAILVLCGCVWSRLLTLKNQLADFDRHVQVVEGGPGLELRLREPAVQPGDIAYLFDGGPSRIEPRPDGTWRHVFRFTRPTLPGHQGLELAFTVRGTLIIGAGLPPEMLSILPRERLLAILRALGKAEVDRSAHAANAAVDGAQVVLGRDQIIASLGPPDGEIAVPDSGGTDLAYHYRLQLPTGSGAKAVLTLRLRDGGLAGLGVAAARFTTWMDLAGR